MKRNGWRIASVCLAAVVALPLWAPDRATAQPAGGIPVDRAEIVGETATEIAGEAAAVSEADLTSVTFDSDELKAVSFKTAEPSGDNGGHAGSGKPAHPGTGKTERPDPCKPGRPEPGKPHRSGPDKPTRPDPGKPKPPDADEPPVFENVSVHDPSIIRADGQYYVFGSHIEAARSPDLMRWTRFTNGYTTPGNALYGDLSANLAPSFAWAGENDADSRGGYAVWAPDVMWVDGFVNEDGTTGAYLMYYSVSSTYIRSAIGFAASKTIEGPYKHVDTIVYSGFTRDEAYDNNSTVNKKWTNTHLPALIAEGKVSGINPAWFNANGSYRNSVYPNAIDANLFRDADGRLWMAYGSWSGGIFLLEIDEATGRPIYPGEDGTTADGRLIDRYFGIKIAGGYGKSGEGPYVVYDEKTGYYYLYMSYGWLGADGGYNIRVFRATSPEGPYLDAQGQNAVLPGNVDNAPYGNKLMGNYLFERKIGDPGTGIGVGYLSPGHNSVYVDKNTGQRFLVFHTRFPQSGEYHEVRVHQLFMNKRGWPVAAPYRYAGETLTPVNEKQLVGEYKFINHGKSYSGVIQRSVFIRLNGDHTITGDVTGTWRKTGKYDAQITVDGVTYYGVFVRFWDPVSERWVMTFTAMSDQGIAVWGSRLQDRTDRQVVRDVLNDLDLGDTAHVVADLTLPTEGTRHAVISWTSSNPDVVSDTGVITRPEIGAEPATAVLTATVTKGTATGTRDFTITVLPKQPAVLKAHYPFEDDLRDSEGNFGAGTVTGDRIDKAGGTVTFADGVIGKAAVFDGGSGVRLPDGLIAGHNYSVSLWLKPDALTTFTTAFFGARDPDHWISLVPQGPVANNTMLWSHDATSGRWYDAPAGMRVGTGAWTHLAFTIENGAVKLYVNGIQRFSGKDFPNIFTSGNAWFSLGVNWWDPPFRGMIDELRVYEGILTEDEVWDLAHDPSVPASDIQLGFSEKRISVGGTFTPSSVAVTPAFAGIRWHSADPSVAAVDARTGRVTDVGAGSTTITASSADGGASTSYTIHVLDGPIAHYRFEGDLAAAAGIGGGMVTGDRLDRPGGTITYADGAAGQAVVFDGTSGIRLPDGLITGNEYTVTMAVHVEQASQYTTAFFGARSPDSWISFVPRGPGDAQPTMLWSGTAWYDASTGLQIPTGTWMSRLQ